MTATRIAAITRLVTDSGGHRMPARATVQFFGESRSFPNHEAPFDDLADATVLILAGAGAGQMLDDIDTARYSAVLVEIGTESLGVWTGESRGEEGSNVIGFNRYRLGDRPPTNLVELIKQPRTTPEALQVARETLEEAGLTTAICNDFTGRIVDRLVRPYFNAALQALDEGLATADDLDLTVRLGLGYPEGPIALLEDSGLAAHAEISQALHDVYGEISLVPARRAQVARSRKKAQE
jgi:3-hydroxybutyryl-CoA dehydrogenase